MYSLCWTCQCVVWLYLCWTQKGSGCPKKSVQIKINMDMKRKRLPVSASQRHCSRSVSFHAGWEANTVLIPDSRCCCLAAFLSFILDNIETAPMLTSMACHVNIQGASSEGGVLDQLWTAATPRHSRCFWLCSCLWSGDGGSRGWVVLHSFSTIRAVLWGGGGSTLYLKFTDTAHKDLNLNLNLFLHHFYV